MTFDEFIAKIKNNSIKSVVYLYNPSFDPYQPISEVFFLYNIKFKSTDIQSFGVIQKLLKVTADAIQFDVYGKELEFTNFKSGKELLDQFTIEEEAFKNSMVLYDKKINKFKRTFIGTIFDEKDLPNVRRLQ